MNDPVKRMAQRIEGLKTREDALDKLANDFHEMEMDLEFQKKVVSKLGLWLGRFLPAHTLKPHGVLHGAVECDQCGARFGEDAVPETYEHACPEGVDANTRIAQLEAELAKERQKDD